MPIEFACEACSQLLRLPDGSQGQSCHCPVCNQLLTIPDPAPAPDRDPAKQLKVQASVQEQPAQEQPAGQLKIACPNCRFELRCATSLLGTKGQCRNCRTIFTIAQNPADRVIAASGASEPGLIFNCPQCDQLFEGRAEMEGRKGKCHACGAVFAIQLKPTHAAATESAKPSQRSQPSQPVAQAIQIAAKDTAIPAAGHSQSASIQFTCEHCHGVMEVPGSTAGRATECPYCQQRLIIPRQSSVPSAPAESSGKYFSPHTAGQLKMFPDSPAPVTRRGTSAGGAKPATDLSSFPEDNANPYAAPMPDPYWDSDSSGDWDQLAPSRKLRGLTFANVFELTFASLFPYCLVATALFVLVAGLSLGLVLASGALAGAVVSVLELDPSTTVGMGVIYSAVGIAVLVAVFLVTAAFCMTCNTALHVVRGRPITRQVLFGTGESYGGMLVIMLGWTAFNILRDRGIPWLTKELADAGQPDTAVVVALVAIVVLFLVQISLMMLLAFVPYALLDGQSLPDAMATSSSIFLGNFLTLLAVNVCGSLLYALVSVVTCGVGAIVFVGGLLYMNASVYKLAKKR